MAEQTSWYGSFLAKFSPRVQEKLMALAEPFQFKAGQDIIGEGDSSLYLYIRQERPRGGGDGRAIQGTLYDPHWGRW